MFLKKNEKKSLKYLFLQNLCLKLADRCNAWILSTTREKVTFAVAFLCYINKKTYLCSGFSEKKAI